MYCSGCGQVWMAGQGYCPRCGRASGAAMSMGYGPVLPVLERRIDALGVAWVVYAGCSLLLGIAGLTFAHAWLAGHEGNWGAWGMHGWHGAAFPLLLRFGWVALFLRVGLAAAAGFGLLQKASWGRWAAIVAALLAVLHMPFGTAIAIWTFVVLLSARNAAGYQALAR